MSFFRNLDYHLISTFLSLILLVNLSQFVKDVGCSDVCSHLRPTWKCNESPDTFDDAKVMLIPMQKYGTFLFDLSCNSPGCYDVTLMSDLSGKFLDCSDARNLMFVENVLMTCNNSYEFSQGTKKPGNYCIQYWEFDSEEDDDFGRCLKSKIYTGMVYLPDPESTITLITDEVTHLTHYLMMLTAVPFLFITVAFLIYFWYKYLRSQERPIISETMSDVVVDLPAVFSAISSSKPVRVYIVHSQDCERHGTVVNSLATFFSSNNCVVSYGPWEMNQIATNKVGWISDKINGNYKILIIASEDSFNKQQAWINNKSSVPSGTILDQLFYQAISMIMYKPQLALNYSKIFMLRPSYVPKSCLLRGICPERHYTVPEDTATLLCHLHGIDTNQVNLNDEHQWEHCSTEYKNLVDSVNAAMVEKDAQKFQFYPEGQIQV